MTTRRRTVRNVGVAARPRYTWRFFNSPENVTVPGVGVFVLFANTGAWPDLVDLGVFGDFTIRRLHATLLTTSALGSETNVMDQVVYGAGVFEVDAITAGAFPDPLEDAFDWFAFGSVGVSLASAGLTAGVHPMQSEKIDSKSMRKVNANHQQPGMIVFSSAFNAGNITWTLGGRMLVSHGRG